MIAEHYVHELDPHPVICDRIAPGSVVRFKLGIHLEIPVYKGFGFVVSVCPTEFGDVATVLWREKPDWVYVPVVPTNPFMPVQMTGFTTFRK